MGILMVPIELVPNSKGLIYFGEETITSLIPGFGLNAVVIRKTLEQLRGQEERAPPALPCIWLNNKADHDRLSYHNVI